MSSIDWGIIGTTCCIASVLVVVVIIIINTQGRRGQALTWLPSSLATILALQYVTDKSQLNTLLEAAYASQIISASFIIVFYFVMERLFKETISLTKENIILWSSVTASIIVPGIFVYFICKLNPFWPFFFGTLGNVVIIFFLKQAPQLKFEKKNNVKENCKRFVCNKTEIFLIIGSIIGTNTFIIIPAWLSNIGYADIAGIVSNAPKISFIIMLGRWVQTIGCSGSCCTKTESYEEKRLLLELKEHLIMFAYSTGITTIFLIVVWFNQNEYHPENFWWAWSAAFFLSIIIIIGVLLPLCCSSNAKSVKRKLRVSVPGAFLTVPTGVQKELAPINQELKW